MSDTIDTPEALDALPAGTVVLDHMGDARQSYDDTRGWKAWRGVWSEFAETSEEMVRNTGGTFTVLFRPDAPTPTPADDYGAIQQHKRVGYAVPAEPPRIPPTPAEEDREALARVLSMHGPITRTDHVECRGCTFATKRAPGASLLFARHQVEQIAALGVRS